MCRIVHTAGRCKVVRRTILHYPGRSVLPGGLLALDTGGLLCLELCGVGVVEDWDGYTAAVMGNQAASREPAHGGLKVEHMGSPPVYTPAYLDNAHRMATEGATLREIATALGGTPDLIAKNLRTRGTPYQRPHRPAHNAKPLPTDEVIAAFNAGESVKSIAQRYKVQRLTVSSCLLRHGVKPRDRSEGMFARMARTSPEGRKELAEAAHAAVRGKPMAREHQLKLAAARGRRIGFGEEEFADLLTARGYEVNRQAPVDVYNIDLLVGGTVAMELRCDTAYPSKKPHQRKRIEHFLHAGLSVLYIQFREVEALFALADEVIADLDELRRLPAGQCEYRMVWCRSEHFTRGRDDLGQLTAVPSAPRYRRELGERQAHIPG